MDRGAIRLPFFYMNSRNFLLRLLGSIFFVQASVFIIALSWCMMNGGPKSCPNLKESYNETFNVMIATTLALLTATRTDK